MNKYPTTTHKTFYSQDEYAQYETECLMTRIYRFRQSLIALKSEGILKDRHFKKAMKNLNDYANARGICLNDGKIK